MLNGIYQQTKLTEIAFGALLHDIGLSKLPEIFTRKFLTQQLFTDEEAREYHRHPHESILILGKLLKSTHITPNVTRIILEHHENLSGTGFPKKLSAKQILFSSQILAVAERISLEMFNNRSTKLDWIISLLLHEQDENNIYNKEILYQIKNNLMIAG